MGTRIRLFPVTAARLPHWLDTFRAYAKGEYVDIDGRFENFKWKMQEFFDNDIRWVTEQYFSQTHAMIDAGGFNIIGHFDKVGHNASHFRPGIEDESWFDTLLDGVIDHIAASGIIAEVNTKALADHHRTFPNRRLWHRLKRPEYLS